MSCSYFFIILLLFEKDFQYNFFVVVENRTFWILHYDNFESQIFPFWVLLLLFSLLLFIWLFLLLFGEGTGDPLQCSCLENPMAGGAWQASVHGAAKSRTWLRDCTFTSHFHALEREMATHSSVLSWRIPGTGEPGGLPSLGSHRVGHDWSDAAAAIIAICLMSFLG